MKVIHSISDNRGRFIKVGRYARSRCGKIANVTSISLGACVMTDAAGNQFYGSTHAEAVTCKKCINLQTVGTIHSSSKEARQ
jgi:hypothetical protein